jgi:hypothetical protein
MKTPRIRSEIKNYKFREIRKRSELGDQVSRYRFIYRPETTISSKTMLGKRRLE